MTHAAAPEMLEVVDLEVRYGAIRAIKGISFHVGEGEIVALLGANGAGKTTTQKTISGMLRPSAGRITFLGQRIDSVPAHELIRLGICHAPEGRHVFPRMTVAENLDMGAFRFKKIDQADLDRVLELFPRLQERYRQVAGTLSGGEQQMLAIGRALMGKPRLLLLDEPSMGLAPMVVAQIFDIVREINESASPSCSWSRTLLRRSRWPTAVMYSRRASSCCTARALSCSPTTGSGPLISARKSPRPESVLAGSARHGRDANPPFRLGFVPAMVSLVVARNVGLGGLIRRGEIGVAYPCTGPSCRVWRCSWTGSSTQSNRSATRRVRRSNVPGRND
jgi:branched-chain amino acid transport system ATP-binding protein